MNVKLTWIHDPTALAMWPIYFLEQPSPSYAAHESGSQALEAWISGLCSSKTSYNNQIIIPGTRVIITM